MPDRAVILDLDGTLLDTVTLHAEAFTEAFREIGVPVPADRVALEVGKGGDRVVPALLGAACDDRHGERLRERHGELYRKRIESGVRVLPGVHGLLSRLRQRGIATAVATASKEEDLDAVLDAARLPLHELVDIIVTNADVERSKPAPDAVQAAVHKLGLAPTQCVMIGDTRWDVRTAKRAGVAALGVCTGPHDADELRHEGARAAYPDLAALLGDLDRVLALGFPGTPASDARLRRWLDDAGAGALIARSDGTVLARASDDPSAGPTGHAALAAVIALGDTDATDLVLATDREPCVQCWGAAVMAGIDVVVYRRPDPDSGGVERVTAPTHARMPRAVLLR